MNNLIYVYCLTNAPPPKSFLEEFSEIRFIRVAGFYVIVKDVSTAEFSEEALKINLSDVAWLDKHARSHIHVINLLMEDSSVIPFKFGTIFFSEEPLIRFIDDHTDSLVDNLLLVECKEEWTVKLYSKSSVLVRHIDSLSAEAAELEKQILASSPGKGFLLRKKKEELVASEVNRICKVFGQECYNDVAALSVKSMLNNLLPKELTGRDDNMIMNATFLVEREKTLDLVSIIRGFKKKHETLGFDIELSGPWPPFNFIHLKENLNVR